jgi:hypothetical protein
MINMTMAMSSSDDTKNPLTFDHDSEKLNIIFGTFATLIALFCLVFAALTWYTPRRRPSAQLRASNEHDLENNVPQSAIAVARDSTNAADSKPRYVG